MEEFIKTLTEQMRCVKARDGVARELSDHIADQTEAYEQSGIEHDQAVERAVREMGDPVEIGVAMDRIHRPQVDWKMLVIILMLSIAGLMCMIPICGFDYVISRQSLFVLAGFVVIAGVYFIDYSIIGRIGAAAYMILTIFLLIGRRTMPVLNGRVPAMSILVYLYVPVFAGILYQLRMRGYAAVVIGIMTADITFVFVTNISNSASVSSNIYLILIVMMFTAIGKGMFGRNKKRISAITAAAVILPMVLLLVYASVGGMSYRMARLAAFFDRDKYSTTVGYVYGVIADVMQHAKFVGRGSSRYADYFTSSDGMDLMPLCIIHSCGIMAAALVLILFMVLILRAAKITYCQKNQLGFLVSMGCSLVIAVNCLEGILVSLGWLPLTSVIIPFLTRGGSAVLVYSVLIGLLLGVHRYEKVYTREMFAHQPRWRVSLKVERR